MVPDVIARNFHVKEKNLENFFHPYVEQCILHSIKTVERLYFSTHAKMQPMETYF